MVGHKRAKHRPVMLAILDGWGWRRRRPTMRYVWPGHLVRQLVDSYPHAFLQASDRDMDLPDGQMGNSELRTYQHSFRTSRVTRIYHVSTRRSRAGKWPGTSDPAGRRRLRGPAEPATSGAGLAGRGAFPIGTTLRSRKVLSAARVPRLSMPLRTAAISPTIRTRIHRSIGSGTAAVRPIADCFGRYCAWTATYAGTVWPRHTAIVEARGLGFPSPLGTCDAYARNVSDESSCRRSLPTIAASRMVTGYSASTTARTACVGSIHALDPAFLPFPVDAAFGSLSQRA